MKGYKQLTPEQRYQIYALKKAGHDRTHMAKIIGVHKSTLPKGHPRVNCAATAGNAAIVPNRHSRWRLHGNNKALTAPQSPLRLGP